MRLLYGLHLKKAQVIEEVLLLLRWRRVLLGLGDGLQRRLLEVVNLGLGDFLVNFFGHPLGLALIRVVAWLLAKRRSHLELLDLRSMPQSFGIISAEILEEALIARRTERRCLCLTLFPGLLLW